MYMYTVLQFDTAGGNPVIKTFKVHGWDGRWMSRIFSLITSTAIDLGTMKRISKNSSCQMCGLSYLYYIDLHLARSGIVRLRNATLARYGME